MRGGAGGSAPSGAFPPVYWVFVAAVGVLVAVLFLSKFFTPGL